ncbi:MAG: hypothetical protein Q7V56_09180 [Gammaproteobacteria bacterium]|nr:hypothetical protein [Gammaproteobacteria bacterium]
MPIINDHSAGVSWGAVLAGAVCAAALSFILLILGFGLGLSAVSPWSNTGAGLAAIGISSIVWVAFTQITASGLGGYIAGRLRVRWADVHNDEVYFRDTAHGLIAWSIATLAAAVLLTSTLSTVLGGGLRLGAEVGEGVTEGASQVVATVTNAADSYFTDALLRPQSATAVDAAGDSMRAEISTILLHNLSGGELSAADTQYMARVIGNHTGLSQAQSESRVLQIFAEAQQAAIASENTAREAADIARKAASTSALWMFVALLCGAFFASLMATLGGRQRDAVASF